MSNSTQRSRRHQAGAAMMETLVSLFLLAIGLLGTLAMQVKGVNSNQRAQFTTDANILAEDMANRILGYVRNLDGSVATSSDTLDDYHGIDTSDTSASDPSCVTGGCSPAQQLVFDEWQWTTDIQSRLPNGVGTVSYTSGSYQITVMWNHNQIENPTTNCAGSETDLACFTYELKLE